MNAPPQRLLLSLLLLTALTLATLLLTRAASPPIPNTTSPNLLPFTPPGWPAPLVPSAITGTHTTETLYAGLGVPTYFDWGIANASDIPITIPTTTCITLNGELILSPITASYPANHLETFEDYLYALSEPGTFTLTVTADCTQAIAESDETDNTWSATFTWHPYISIIIADEHGFDKCDIATTSQMNTWWTASPYYYSNIYIGGIARACPNTGLTNNWIRNVVERGWNLLPTWVGPQAPCSAFTHRFSPNPGTAREQGRREADAAYQTAQALGLIPPGSPTILYYDLEAFPNQKLCRQAAGQFLSGWTARLHELGQQSGIYGAGCGSYPVDWPALPDPPDAVWLAHWIFGQYTASATVWDVACVPNTLWDNHERIRQYTGGHNETWGGITLNIDSNIADGPVVGINPSLQTTASTEGPIQDFQLLAPDQGWALQNHQLHWKNPGEALWTDRTPADTFPLAAFFLNPDQGWIASPARTGGTSSVEERIAIHFHSTSDQGRTWQPAGTVTLPTPHLPGKVWLRFLDAQTGWAAFQLPSSSNFSLGALFRTTNGGQNWEELPLPVASPVYFVDAYTGWTAGGVMGDELYVTHNGGGNWSTVTLTPARAGYALPTFVNGTGFLAATLPGEAEIGTDTRVVIFTSTNSGQSWQPTAEIALASPGPFHISFIDANTWLIADSATNTLWTTKDAGQTLTPAPLPAAPVAMQYLTPVSGWVLTWDAHCTGPKGTPDFSCQVRQTLLKTTEGEGEWEGLWP